jgi:hypothetical protein
MEDTHPAAEFFVVLAEFAPPLADMVGERELVAIRMSHPPSPAPFALYASQLLAVEAVSRHAFRHDH